MGGELGGDRRTRLGRFAKMLRPTPEIPPYYVQVPDDVHPEAPGWHLKLEGRTLRIGYSFVDAERWIKDHTPKKRRRRSPAEGRPAA